MSNPDSPVCRHLSLRDHCERCIRAAVAAIGEPDVDDEPTAFQDQGTLVTGPERIIRGRVVDRDGERVDPSALLTGKELAEVEREAGLVLADPDEERECLRCGQTMGAPSVDEDGAPLCRTCIWRVAEELAVAVPRLLATVKMLTVERDEALRVTLERPVEDPAICDVIGDAVRASLCRVLQELSGNGAVAFLAGHRSTDLIAMIREASHQQVLREREACVKIALSAAADPTMGDASWIAYQIERRSCERRK